MSLLLCLDAYHYYKHVGALDVKLLKHLQWDDIFSLTLPMPTSVKTRVIKQFVSVRACVRTCVRVGACLCMCACMLARVHAC